MPPIELPMFTFVVDPLAPPVPKLTALVVAVAVGAVAKLYVLAPVLALPILIVCAAVALPIFTVVAAPNAVAVVKFVLKNVSVPVLVPANVGLAPLTFTAVALANVTVGLLTVIVPVLAPTANVDAAPNAFKVVAVVFNKLNVV